MMGWFQALMPKEDRFFALFNQHAELLVQGAHALRGVLDGGPDGEAKRQAVMAFEDQADAVTREVTQLLSRTLVTPFDRGDIKELITSMDDSIDQMRKSVKTIVLFEITEFPPPMRELGDQIIKASGLVQQAVALLPAMIRNAPQLNALAEQISSVEEASDLTQQQGIKVLFAAGKKDPMAYIVGAEIYDHLERVLDRFEDVAHRISGMIIEHA